MRRTEAMERVMSKNTFDSITNELRICKTYDKMPVSWPTSSRPSKIRRLPVTIRTTIVVYMQSWNAGVLNKA